jgi:hypothetical protein
VVTTNKLFLFNVQDKKCGNKDIVQKMLEVSGGGWHANIIIIITGFEIWSALDKIQFLWDINGIVIGR